MENQNDTATTVSTPHYGELLAEKIRATAVFSNLTHFEKFVIDRGWEFEAEGAFKAGYDRAWKCSRNILITRDEFIAEAGEHFSETAGDTYDALVNLVSIGKLCASEVYSYARFKWCIDDASAIVAYEYERGKWLVNNCGTKVSDTEAIVKVNGEWGFEASRIEIIGTPYYDATDYQYIRFDCAHMTWLWKNGNLCQVYA